MDRMLYIAMTGASQAMNALGVSSNNLANAKTTGFKADLVQARSMQAYGEGLPTRVFSMMENPGHKMSAGAVVTTGRELDVAVKGDGWLAVADGEGNEAYSRNGRLQLGADGLLQNGSGQYVLDEAGNPLFVPQPYAKLEVGGDGTVSVLPAGAPANGVEIVGRIKLVNPDPATLDKGEDGLFRPLDGTVLPPDPTLTLMQGALEDSNVNVVEELTAMINLQRNFELQVKVMKTAEQTDEAQSSLLRLG
ncbi:MAG: flagellar basal-body rod protein FlgF [Gammaproteobacteria bacterium]|nr:flagellar basal-body rod protein FlgF [Gammaproteobacteria bacterium]